MSSTAVITEEAAVVRVANLGKTFGGGCCSAPNIAVEKVSFEIKRGEIFGSPRFLLFLLCFVFDFSLICRIAWSQRCWQEYHHQHDHRFDRSVCRRTHCGRTQGEFKRKREENSRFCFEGFGAFGAGASHAGRVSAARHSVRDAHCHGAFAALCSNQSTQRICIFLFVFSSSFSRA